MKKIYYALIFSLLFCCALSQKAINKTPSNTATTEPIPVDKAFQLSAAARDNQTILLRWKIASGYYLYRARFHFHAIKPKGAVLAPPLLPEGTKKTAPEMGGYEVYSDTVTIPIPVIKPQGKTILLTVNYQGCSAVGYCYPPITKVIEIDLSKNYMVFKKSLSIDVSDLADRAKTTEATPEKLSETQQLLRNGNLWAVIFGFLGIGILLSFTPCVLPMIPILSSIITGQKKITTLHAFLLSLAYVLGMAITYAIVGAIAGLIGESIQASLQTPWVIILFSLIFVAMALSLFGFYDIQLPKRWRSKIAKASEHQKKGTYAGVFIMGILSSLILSPCVTAPLVGVLSYIGHSGNALFGGLTLFIMGVGMGLPLLAIGISHGKLIPKVGPWMNDIKNWMGIIMLALAIWMLQRIWVGTLIMLLWAALAIGISIYMRAFSTVSTRWGIVRKTLGIVIFVYGILLIVGATRGHSDPLKPLEFAQTSMTEKQALRFEKVKTVGDVKKAVLQAKLNGKPVLLDFWAQWCPSCEEMDDFIFANHRIQKRLKDFVLLKADVSKNDAQDKALERHFNVVAPPTILFFKEGKELKNARIIGKIAPDDFIAQLNRVESAD